MEEGLLTVPLLAGLQKDNEGDRDGESEDGPKFTKPEAPSPFLDLFFFAEKVRGARSSLHARIIVGRGIGLLCGMHEIMIGGLESSVEATKSDGE